MKRKSPSLLRVKISNEQYFMSFLLAGDFEQVVRFLSEIDFKVEEKIKFLQDAVFRYLNIIHSQGVLRIVEFLLQQNSYPQVILNQELLGTVYAINKQYQLRGFKMKFFTEMARLLYFYGAYLTKEAEIMVHNLEKENIWGFKRFMDVEKFKGQHKKLKQLKGYALSELETIPSEHAIPVYRKVNEGKGGKVFSEGMEFFEGKGFFTTE